jgi:hypothetical protein
LPSAEASCEPQRLSPLPPDDHTRQPVPDIPLMMLKALRSLRLV